MYNDVITAIGNTNPRAPNLVIKNTSSNPAAYYPKKNIIRKKANDMSLK